MVQFLGLTLLSSFITAILLIPFIDFLYKIKFQRKKQYTKDPFNQPTPIFDKLHAHKAGVPFGGGILIILVVSILTLWTFGIFNTKTNPWVIFVILFSFVSFGLLGLYDDVKKLVKNDSVSAFFGLRFRHKLIIQLVLAFIIASVFYYQLGYHFIFIL